LIVFRFPVIVSPMRLLHLLCIGAALLFAASPLEASDTKLDPIDLAIEAPDIPIEYSGTLSGVIADVRMGKNIEESGVLIVNGPSARWLHVTDQAMLHEFSERCIAGERAVVRYSVIEYEEVEAGGILFGSFITQLIDVKPCGSDVSIVQLE
jgi:hypothetical protein